jgi:hypothetical protein
LSWIGQAETLIRHYLHREPSDNLDVFQQEFASALWLEERFADVLAGALSKR